MPTFHSVDWAALASAIQIQTIHLLFEASQLVNINKPNSKSALWIESKCKYMFLSSSTSTWISDEGLCNTFYCVNAVLISRWVVVVFSENPLWQQKCTAIEFLYIGAVKASDVREFSSVPHPPLQDLMYLLCLYKASLCCFYSCSVWSWSAPLSPTGVLS